MVEGGPQGFAARALLLSRFGDRALRARVTAFAYVTSPTPYPGTR
jgi:hypothetical protein